MEFPRECASGFCESLNGICTDQCASDAECGNGLICTDADKGNVVGRWCAEPCATMNDCGYTEGNPDSRICRRRCDIDAPAAERRFDRACGARVGTLSTNAPLATGDDGGDCRSGFSITNGATNERYCSQPCVLDNDCPSAMACTHTSTSTCGTTPDNSKYCRRR